MLHFSAHMMETAKRSLARQSGMPITFVQQFSAQSMEGATRRESV